MKTVEEARQKARDLNRAEQIPTVLVFTYQPNFGGLQEICKNNWDLLKRSTATKELSEQKIIYGYRRPKNLKDILVRAKLPTTNNQNKEPKKGPQNVCIRKNC